MSQETAQMQGEVLTGEDLLAMRDIGPCELVDGKVVPMTPTGGGNARIEAALGLELALFVRQRQRGLGAGG